MLTDNYWVFIAQDSIFKESCLCGYNAEGHVEFGTTDKEGNYKMLIAIDQATFNALLKEPLGKPPIFISEESKQYFDEKFTRIERLLGAI